MKLVKIKDKQDFINAITQAIKEIDLVDSDTPSKEKGKDWYWAMMALRSEMMIAKARHK